MNKTILKIRTTLLTKYNYNKTLKIYSKILKEKKYDVKINLHQLRLSKLTTAYSIKQFKTFKILVVPGQRLERLCAKIEFLKIRVLHFAIKNSKLVCKMSGDNVPKKSASINRVFKKLRVPWQAVCDYRLLFCTWFSLCLYFGSTAVWTRFYL